MDNKSKPAFPNEYRSGMTLREYYAGLAMHGIFSNGSKTPNEASEVAKIAVKAADHLIAGLQEGGDE